MSTKKTALTPAEKLRVAHAYLINDVKQQHLASLMGVNSGRIAEAIAEVKTAISWDDAPSAAIGEKV